MSSQLLTLLLLVQNHISILGDNSFHHMLTGL